MTCCFHGTVAGCLLRLGWFALMIVLGVISVIAQLIDVVKPMARVLAMGTTGIAILSGLSSQTGDPYAPGLTLVLSPAIVLVCLAIELRVADTAPIPVAIVKGRSCSNSS